MNTTLAFRAALGVTALSGVLHAYENFAKAAEPSLTWFLWAMLPYGVCLVVWVRSSVGAPSLAGVIAALAFDLVAHYDVFVHPTGSTAAVGHDLRAALEHSPLLPCCNARCLARCATARLT